MKTCRIWIPDSFLAREMKRQDDDQKNQKFVYQPHWLKESSQKNSIQQRSKEFQQTGQRQCGTQGSFGQNQKQNKVDQKNIKQKKQTPLKKNARQKK